MKIQTRFNFDLNQNGTNNAREIYITPMSAPFFTSGEKTIGGRYFTWKEIGPRQFPEYDRLSSPGCEIREISKEIHSYFECLLVFLLHLPLFKLSRLQFSDMYKQIEMPKHMVKNSCTVKSLVSLGRISQTLLEERERGRKLKLEIGQYVYSTDYSSSSDTTSISPSYGNIDSELKTRMQQGKIKLKLKEEIESLKLRIEHLSDEKGRSEGRIQRLKRESMMVEDASTYISDELLSRIQALAKEKQRLHELKELVQDNKQRYSQMSSQLFTRKNKLISELLLLYPISLVGGDKRYSINEVQLPNAEDYGSEGGGHISVSLGYTAHMLVTIAFILGIPLRYPIQNFGSKSRIVDHITIQIPDKKRKFPLYFHRKEDVYSIYAVNLLNKNIAQIRWYCGLSTLDLRATLPNLYNLLTSKLSGWPPNPNESLELATEITKEIDQEFYRNDTNLSLEDSGNWGSVGISPKMNQREYSRTPGGEDFKTLREHEILNTESAPPPPQDPNSQVNTNSITEPEANENNSESVENLIPFSPERVCEDQTNPEEVNTSERNYPEEIVNEDTQKKLENEDTDQASNNAIDNNNQKGLGLANDDEDTPMSSFKNNKDESKEQQSETTNADSDLEEYNKQISSFLTEFCDI